MLKPVEREKLQDCLLLIQSARNILSAVRAEIVPGITDIQACFRDADQKISGLLRQGFPHKPDLK